MPSMVIHCVCGYRIEGDSDDALLASLRAHSDEKHTDFAISDDDIRKVLTRRAQMTAWDGTTRTLEASPEIRPLEPSRTDDLLGFFDRDAFQDNPMWGDCYCMFFHSQGGAEWESRTAEQNRRDKETLIRRGDAHGYIAYAGRKPVAWCHAAPRATLPALAAEPHFAVEGDVTGIGSIVCFVVAAPYRRQGLARQLLDAACDGLRDEGLALAEAYPPRGAASDARMFHGPLAMYLAAGFTPHTENERFVIVRKPLG